MRRIMAPPTHLPIHCAPRHRRHRDIGAVPIERSALVLEADLDIDAVLDDLAVADLARWTARPRRSGCCGRSRDAVATAWRAASLHDFGLVPTISLMMMTPTAAPPATSAGAKRRAMMTRGRPVAGPASWLLREIRGNPLGYAVTVARIKRARSDLVEAGLQ